MSTKLKLLGVDVASVGERATDARPGRAPSPSLMGGRSSTRSSFGERGRPRLRPLLIVEARCLRHVSAEDDAPWLTLPNSPRSGFSRIGGRPDRQAPPDSRRYRDAQICSCNNVSRARYETQSIRCTTSVAAIKTKERRQRLRRRCASLVKQILKSELQTQGVPSTINLCEHFGITRRQQL